MERQFVLQREYRASPYKERWAQSVLKKQAVFIMRLKQDI